MTKDKVLLLLKEAKTYLSGEAMSKEIGVSRAAIHTAVNKLRNDGYEIASVTRKGYLLQKSADQLSFGEIASYLSKSRAEKLVYFNQVDSTNTKLKTLATEGAKEQTTVVANVQTAGKGRLGRRFESPENTGVYLSYLLRPNCEVAKLPEITAWSAVAVARAIEKVANTKVDIKWVNDILMHGKKVCGILTEMAMEGETGHIQYVIVGIGVNVHATEFPEELKRKASSVEEECGSCIKRAQLVAAIIQEMDLLYQKWPEEKQEYLQAYGEKCVNLHKEVLVIRKNEEKKGKVTALTEDFQLQVRYEDGTEEIVSSGEVSVRGLHGYI